jgi:hypothetical protein
MEQILRVDFMTFLDIFAFIDVKMCDCYKAILVK